MYIVHCTGTGRVEAAEMQAAMGHTAQNDHYDKKLSRCYKWNSPHYQTDYTQCNQVGFWTSKENIEEYREI